MAKEQDRRPEIPKFDPVEDRKNRQYNMNIYLKMCETEMTKHEERSAQWLNWRNRHKEVSRNIEANEIK